MPPRSFNADQKVQDLIEAEVTIGDRKFHPARLTPDVRREQLEIATDSARRADEANLEAGATISAEAVEAVVGIDENVLLQLAVLLRDADGNRPDIEFLTDALDNRVAGELLAWLLSDEEVDTPGEPAATPAASGT